MGDPEVGRRIKQARQEAELTQAALALRIGLAHPQSVSNYERGVDEPDTDRLRRIAEATRKPISFFVDDRPANAEVGPGEDGVQATLQKVLEEIRLLREGQDEISQRLDRLEDERSQPARRRARGA